MTRQLLVSALSLFCSLGVGCATSSQSQPTPETAHSDPPPSVPPPSDTTPPSDPPVASDSPAPSATPPEASPCAELDGVMRAQCTRKQEFEAFITAHRQCKAASDCATISTRCPFGCNVVVSTSAAKEATALHDRLSAANRAEGTECAYRCRAPGPLACRDNLCTMETETK